MDSAGHRKRVFAGNAQKTILRSLWAAGDKPNAISFLISSFETALTSLILGHSVLLLSFQTLNTELSKKLELQTQRLELVVTQNMANGVSGDVTNLSEEQEAYFVDEGDEVCIICF